MSQRLFSDFASSSALLFITLNNTLALLSYRRYTVSAAPPLNVRLGSPTLARLSLPAPPPPAGVFSVPASLTPRLASPWPPHAALRCLNLSLTPTARGSSSEQGWALLKTSQHTPTAPRVESRLRRGLQSPRGLALGSPHPPGSPPPAQPYCLSQCLRPGPTLAVPWQEVCSPLAPSRHPEGGPCLASRGALLPEVSTQWPWLFLASLGVSLLCCWVSRLTPA